MRRSCRLLRLHIPRISALPSQLRFQQSQLLPMQKDSNPPFEISEKWLHRPSKRMVRRLSKHLPRFSFKSQKDGKVILWPNFMVFYPHPQWFMLTSIQYGESMETYRCEKISDFACLILIASIPTREWVLQVVFWQAGNCSFSVSLWSDSNSLELSDLVSAPTWAVLKNVPPQLYSLDGISCITSAIGEPLHTEKSRLDSVNIGETKVKGGNHA